MYQNSCGKSMQQHTMKFCSSAGVTFELASVPKNPQPTQNTTTRDNSVPAFLKVQQKLLNLGFLGFLVVKFYHQCCQVTMALQLKYR